LLVFFCFWVYRSPVSRPARVREGLRFESCHPDLFFYLLFLLHHPLSQNLPEVF
jgi:hypothetical protein